MIVYFSTAAGLLGALYIALAVTLQSYGADQIRKISKASKRWIVWTPTVGGVAIASCLSMISSAESERPLPAWLTSAAISFISLVVGTLFAILPWAKLRLDGEIAAEDQKEKTQLAERTLDEIASEAAEFLARLKAMNELPADGEPGGVEAANDPASSQKPATNATTFEQAVGGAARAASVELSRAPRPT